MEIKVLYANENSQETSELRSRAVIKQFTSHVIPCTSSLKAIPLFDSKRTLAKLLFNY